MARFLMDSEPVQIMALGTCQIDKAIEVLPGPEAYDTATIIMKFANGKDAVIDVCRQAAYGYDQRAEVLGKKAMIQTDNNYPNVCAKRLPPRPSSMSWRSIPVSCIHRITSNLIFPRPACQTARILSSTRTGNADLPYDFFMSRYKEAYVQETLAFVDALVNDKPAPCSGEDGLIALVMAIAAGTSAAEERWVAFSEVAPELCALSKLDDQCMSAVVDNDTGALNFAVITAPETGIIAAKKVTPAQLFERIASKVWVPPSRPDLKAK